MSRLHNEFRFCPIATGLFRLEVSPLNVFQDLNRGGRRLLDATRDWTLRLRGSSVVVGLLRRRRILRGCIGLIATRFGIPLDMACISPYRQSRRILTPQILHDREHPGAQWVCGNSARAGDLRHKAGNTTITGRACAPFFLCSLMRSLGHFVAPACLWQHRAPLSRCANR